MHLNSQAHNHISKRYLNLININQNRFNFLYFTTYISICTTYLLVSTLANLDLKSGAHVLFMDERLIFDGVQKVLHPGSFHNFLLNVIDGGDQRYGRILWNLSAMFSYLPEKIFGDSGQILATRLLSELCILASAIILSKIFQVSKFSNISILAAVLFFPYASYYSTMPKPEPLVLLFISIAIYFLTKSKTQSKIYLTCFFTGLAFGTKISVLPFVIVVFVILNFVKIKSIGLKRFSAFLIGFTIAVPSLVFTTLPIVLSQIIYLKFINNIDKYKNSFFYFFQILQIFVVYKLEMIISGRSTLQNYISWTFLNTSHGSDSNKINFLSWMKYIFNGWTYSRIIPIFLVFLFTMAAIKVLREKKYRKLPAVLYLVIVAGISMNLLVMIKIHRLWGFYLFIGGIMICVGVFNILLRSFQMNFTKDRIFVFKIAIIFLIPFLYLNNLTDYKTLSKRTTTNEYRIQNQDYDFFTRYLTKYSDRKKSVKVLIDPLLFIPKDTKHFNFIEFWGPLLDFQSADYVITTKLHLPSQSKDKSEIKFIQNQVVTNKNDCKSKICYLKEFELPSGGLILSRIELNK